MTAKIVGIVPVQATAVLPGEVSGPALRVTASLTNGTSAALDLSTVVVNLFDSKGNPCAVVSADQATVPFSGTAAPGETVSGAYLFTIGTDKRSSVKVQVIYAGGAPVGEFVGRVG